ncbi:MAG: hypothetical protein NVS2B12_30180 [Ktedonobacteraceae bacterium]
MGFHNISGILRFSNPKFVAKLEAHYGERCGHLPLDAQKLLVLVDDPTPAIQTHMAYLSQLCGKEIRAVSLEGLRAESAASVDSQRPLVVPYVNVPEAGQHVRQLVDVDMWGLPAQMVHVLKNKADFYQLNNELEADGFRTPDYIIAALDDVPNAAWRFLAYVEELYAQTGLTSSYPLGLVLRAAESDGNYGSCLLYARGSSVLMVRDGDADVIQTYQDWKSALVDAQLSLAATMNVQKETRIAISRFIDMIDSPGLSVVLLDGHAESLRWNGQLQGLDSKACVGTSTYVPATTHLRDLQLRSEDQTAQFFITLLKQTALNCNVDFATIRGLANIDIMLPGAVEVALQRQRKQAPANYLAECNSRWTNYTDAIMVIIGAERQEPTINSMQSVIKRGISTIDKFPLPTHLDTSVVRDHIYELDDTLKQDGTRIVCRMNKNPMGLIFAGDIERAQQEFNLLIARLAARE